MNKRHSFLVIGACIVPVLLYLMGWHTGLGRAVRGVSTIAVVNRSDSPMEHVSIYMTDSQGRQMDRHFEQLLPNQTISVAVRTSDLMIQRIVGEQGTRKFAYDNGANVTPGEVFFVAWDAQGSVSSGYKD
jgi:hypothetical protein